MLAHSPCLVHSEPMFCKHHCNYAHVNNMGLEAHLALVTFKFWPQIHSDRENTGFFFFFFKRTYLFIYLFFIRKCYWFCDENFLGNLCHSRNISAVITNADVICLRHEMFSLLLCKREICILLQGKLFGFLFPLCWKGAL